MGTVVKSGQPCSRCGSSDAVAIYDDGSTYCWSGNHDPAVHGPKHTQPNQQEETRDVTQTIEEVQQLPLDPLDHRGISGSAASLYGVRTEYDPDGRPTVCYFPVTKDGNIVGYQAKRAKAPGQRAKGDVWRVGEKGPDPFGANVVGGQGQFLIVTEGAEDALAAVDLLARAGKRYRVVATFGTDGWKPMLEFFAKWDKVVIAYDMDDAGRKAASAFCSALKPGQGHVMQWEPSIGSDPNELLTNNRSTEFLEAIGKARNVRPDGIVSLADTCDRVLEEKEADSVPYPWRGLNDILFGMRQGELVTWTAGTGVGKSAVIRELEYHLLPSTKENIGILALEESVSRTAWGLLGIHANRPLHIKKERDFLDADTKRRLYNKVFGGNRVHVYDHFGSTAVDNLLAKVRFLIVGLNCRWVFLDHLSIVVSAQQDGGDERRDIDRCMTLLRTIVQETGAGLHLVSHLKRVDGKGHEEGHEVSLNHLRGSAAIAQLSDAVIGLERNQQADDPAEANTTTVRVLKNRYAGITGKACRLIYDRPTGRLSELPEQT